MIRSLSPRELQALVARTNVDIIDVREPNEYAGGHVPDARLVPLEQLRADPASALPHDRVAFVCAKGTRSMVAAKVAERFGLTELYTLTGGTKAWAEEGLPIVSSEGAPTKPAAKPAMAAKASPPVAKPTDQGLDAIIGANVRELRTRRGLTLDALAKRAGVSRDQLGQLELGRGVPSINVVWKLARVLDVPFATLVATTAPEGTVVLRRSGARQLVNSEGRFGSRALFPPSQRGNVEFYELWLAGHSREDAEAHQPGTRENLFVTAGRLDLEVGGEKFRLDAGDAIAFAADAPHAYVNPGSDECWMCLVMTYANATS